jgi:hypothetical protein
LLCEPDRLKLSSLGDIQHQTSDAHLQSCKVRTPQCNNPISLNITARMVSDMERWAVGLLDKSGFPAPPPGSDDSKRLKLSYSAHVSLRF